MEQIPALYTACDLLLLPTLLESFSGTYIEAMHYGVPVCTSDRDFAHVVCGEDAVYFDPTSAQDIHATIRRLLDDPALKARLIEGGRARAAAHPSWPDVAARCLVLLERIGESRESGSPS
jgi:glycosyltransferase involved in cell wall biosynthesis